MNGFEGGIFTLTLLTLQDPGDDTVTDYAIDWGDGVVENYNVLADGAPDNQVFTHTYLDGPAAPFIQVIFTDEDGTQAGGFLTVSPGGGAPGVLNADPTANDDTPSVGEDDGAITFDVLANDTDPAGPLDPLTVTGFDATGTIGLVTNNNDGTFDYDPNGQFGSLAAGESTTDTLPIRLTMVTVARRQGR